MSRTVSRTTFWNSTYCDVVISPNTSTRPVVVAVSHATRALVSTARMESRMASEIWSHILSGWPSVTDSEVKRYSGASRMLMGLRWVEGPRSVSAQALDLHRRDSVVRRREPEHAREEAQLRAIGRLAGVRAAEPVPLPLEPERDEG